MLIFLKKGECMLTTTEMGRTAEWIGPINDEHLKKVMDRLGVFYKDDSAKPMFLMINSGGGSTASGFGFFDLINFLLKPKPRIITIGSGRVSSMAIIVWLAGEERLLTPNTYMFFHEIGRSFEKEHRYDVTQLKASLSEVKIQEKGYAKIVSEKSRGKLNIEKVLKMMKDEVVLSAKEAVKFGLADKITG